MFGNITRTPTADVHDPWVAHRFTAQSRVVGDQSIVLVCLGRGPPPRWDLHDDQVKVIGLTIDERESILRSLEDGPKAFAELRAVLLREHQGRVQLGL